MRTMEEIIELTSDTCNPILHQYYRHLKKRTILINDAITQDIIEMAVLPLLEMDNDGSGEEINIILNTVGGQVYNGLALCDVIEKLKNKTTITVLSYAFSMGSLILMSAFNNPNVTTKCLRFTTALIHGGNQYLEGTASQVKDYFKFNEKYEEKIKEFILSHSKITEKEYKKLERTEWYMTSEDMLKYGLVDEII